MEKEKKFRVVTLGCRTNQYESQAYHNQLEILGYKEATQEETAELCIINTCTVTENADKDSRYQIRQAIKRNAGAQVVVTGCSAEKSIEAIRQIEGVTHVIPNAEKGALIETLFPDIEVPEFSIKNFPGYTRAFVKVQDGCNSFCSYCIIPYVRGRSRSRSIVEILNEVRELVSNGYKEVVLTGINIGDFDGGKKRGETKDRLVDLIRKVDEIPGIERIRVSSIDPDEIGNELADAILHGKNTCHSMHIVLQSGSNSVLKKMNRKYTRQMFMDTVDRLRNASPNFTFTTDVIVGFPGEEEQDFEETLDIIREVQFAKVHMFPYSERQGTRAASFPNKIDSETMKRRKIKALHIAEQVAYDLRSKYVGKEMVILTEGSEDRVSTQGTSGHTENFLQVHIPDVKIPSNTFVKVLLKENSAVGLIGEVIQ